MLPNMKKPAQGMSASAAMGEHNHTRAQQGAFSAQRRLNMARQLGGAQGGAVPAAAPQGPGPGGPDFRHHAAAASGLPNASPQEVHGAIDALAQAGHFTPVQAAALKSHNGPLQGPQGQVAVAKIGQAMKVRRAQAMAMRARQPMPSQGTPAAGGMPAGMGQ
jgi:hypothetical protein